jgi:hypothetical protein
MDSGYVEVVQIDRTNPCEAADHTPQQWGHKCIKTKGHGRKVKHLCRCGHAWAEPTPPDTSKVRTVGADLTL